MKPRLLAALTPSNFLLVATLKNGMIGVLSRGLLGRAAGCFGDAFQEPLAKDQAYSGKRIGVQSLRSSYSPPD